MPASSAAQPIVRSATLFALERNEEAAGALRQVLAAAVDPGWEPEDREFKQQAADRLRQLRQ